MSRSNKKYKRAKAEDLFDYCSGKLDKETSHEIEFRINNDESLASDVENIKKVLGLDQQIEQYTNIDVQKAYRTLKRRLNKSSKIRFSTIFYRIAAIMVIPLLCASALMGYFLIWPTHNETSFIEIKSAPGSIYHCTLPDKSEVWLNSKSRLRYPVRFDQKYRRVEIEGEAYFKVTSDKQHPFYVAMSDHINVKVTGTKFNVNAYSNEEMIEITLERGKVGIISDGNTAEMKPGECYYYNRSNQNAFIKTVKTYEKTAWKDGKTIFRDTPLPEVFRKLSRIYNVDIEFINHSEKNYSYRATFTNENIYQILDYLKMTAPLEWKQIYIQGNDEHPSNKKIIVTMN